MTYPGVPRIALATVLRNEEAWLQKHIDHHRAVGISRYYIHLDRCTDRSRQIAEENRPLVRIIDGPVDLEGEGPYFSILQRAVMKSAMKLALEEAYDWLLFADVDEYAFADNAGVADLSDEASLVRMMEGIPKHVDQVVLRPREAIARTLPSGRQPMIEDLHFFIPIGAALKRKVRHPHTGKRHTIRGPLGHKAGKSLIRVSLDFKPLTAHIWGKEDETGALCELVPGRSVDSGILYHYAVISQRHWREKYLKLSEYADTWITGRPIEYFKRASMDLALSGDEAEVSEWLKHMVVRDRWRLLYWWIRGWVVRDCRIGRWMKQVSRKE